MPLDYLMSPFLLPFMQDAFVVGTLIAISTGLLSPFLVLKGWSLMGDAIAHAILPGLIIALNFGFSPFIGAFITGLICIIVSGYLQSNTRIKPETIIGVVFASLFGLGLILHSHFNVGVDIHHILLGDILGISSSELDLMMLVTGFVVIVVSFFWRSLMLYCFDNMYARSIGLNTTIIHYGLLFLIVICTVSSISVTGVILTVAFLVAPGAVGFLLSKRLSKMITISVITAVLCTLIGVYLSFYINSAPAPTVVLFMSLIFLFVFLFKKNEKKAI